MLASFSLKTVLASSLLYLLLNANPALASQVQFGTPTMAGTGCPNSGPFAAQYNESKQTLKFYFDQFTVHSQELSGQLVGRKNCSIAIPVQVSPGHSITIPQATLNGFYHLTQDASATVNVESFFTGLQGPQVKQTFWGPASQTFTMNNPLPAQSLTWSPCGKAVILRLAIDARLKLEHPAAEGMIDISETGDLAVRIRKCK